jgi:hypothetical protein
MTGVRPEEYQAVYMSDLELLDCHHKFCLICKIFRIFVFSYVIVKKDPLTVFCSSRLAFSKTGSSSGPDVRAAVSSANTVRVKKALYSLGGHL